MGYLSAMKQAIAIVVILSGLSLSGPVESENDGVESVSEWKNNVVVKCSCGIVKENLGQEKEK